MTDTWGKRGRVVIIGGGPAGMATALSVHRAGHEVVVLERYPQARPAGNILNLWPPPIKALGLLGVDTRDLGAACQSEFRRVDGRLGQGLISLQSPSEMTSTVPSTTLMAVLSSMA